jgi:hypothetical protein
MTAASFTCCKCKLTPPQKGIVKNLPIGTDRKGSRLLPWSGLGQDPVNDIRLVEGLACQH